MVANANGAAKPALNGNAYQIVDHTYDVVENTRQAYQAGFAFGSFQDLISDMNLTSCI